MIHGLYGFVYYAFLGWRKRKKSLWENILEPVHLKKWAVIYALYYLKDQSYFLFASLCTIFQSYIPDPLHFFSFSNNVHTLVVSTYQFHSAHLNICLFISYASQPQTQCFLSGEANELGRVNTQQSFSCALVRKQRCKSLVWSAAEAI